MDGWKQRDNNSFLLELGAYSYAAIYLERSILGEIWDGGDSWAGLDCY